LLIGNFSLEGCELSQNEGMVDFAKDNDYFFTIAWYAKTMKLHVPGELTSPNARFTHAF